MKKLIWLLLIGVAAAQAPGPDVHSGRFLAANYGQWSAQITSIPSATQVCVNAITVVLADGSKLNPWNTNAPIIFSGGTSQAETLTPTSFNFTQSPGQTCITVSAFAHTHFTGDSIGSGTFGLQEALNAAGVKLGGAVSIDQNWTALGGTTAIVNAAAIPLNTNIEDLRSGVSSGGAVSSVAGLGGEFVGLDMGWGAVQFGGSPCTAANIVNGFQFVQRYTQTFTRMAIRVTTTFGTSSHIGVALYNSAGTQIPNATTGALDGTAIGAPQVVTVPSVTLTPGIYYVGISTDGATSGAMVTILLSVSNSTITEFTNTARGTRIFTGSSASVGGVPPATLGTLSSQTTAGVIPLLWIEP